VPCLPSAAGGAVQLLTEPMLAGLVLGRAL
jgi:hypothetical protein